MKPDPQLRLSLLALHRRVVFMGPLRNFFILLVLLFAAQMAIIYLDYSISNFTIFLFIGLTFVLHKTYCIDLPATRKILDFFEQNHPEMCSWLEESAVLEAVMMYEKK